MEEKIQKTLDTNATKLDLTSMELTTLPSSIAKLTNLEILHLSNNHLTSLPDLSKFHQTVLTN